mmetsp:Transcript_33915/g.38586  ORF Transcript_33915/g.38586 Transcript_33915/m.38586 type:complete len:139 (+) Transcript_33915:83-499(+)
MKITIYLITFLFSVNEIDGLSFNGGTHRISRREAIMVGLGSSLLAPIAAQAAPDCMTDCVKNCKRVAPKDPEYCTDNCKSYCDQPDRTDGLSGSVSSTGGETGILGTTTVVKGEDKPPSIKIPFLDFTSSSGKKLIGY